MVSGVEISPGVTTTQNIEMFLAPIWNISGVVTDSQTGEPLFASIALEDTPASTESNPETGAYSVAAAQGEWWLVVTSPGYAEEAIKIKPGPGPGAEFQPGSDIQLLYAPFGGWRVRSPV